MFRIAYILITGETGHKDLDTIELCYEYLLNIEYNKYVIMNIETKEMIDKN